MDWNGQLAAELLIAFFHTWVITTKTLLMEQKEWLFEKKNYVLASILIFYLQ